MKPEAITKAFQTELVQLMNKYTGGAMNKKVSARDRCKLGHDFQVYLLMAATKSLIPAGTQNAIDSVILSNCKMFERLQRMVYKAESEPTIKTRGEGNGPQAPSENTIPQVEQPVADTIPSGSEVQIISRTEAKELGLPGSDGA